VSVLVSPRARLAARVRAAGPACGAGGFLVIQVVQPSLGGVKCATTITVASQMRNVLDLA
jgi:hypothetical protein